MDLVRAFLPMAFPPQPCRYPDCGEAVAQDEAIPISVWDAVADTYRQGWAHAWHRPA